MNAGRIVIRKYGNRRLYDTSSSRYVNLEELAAMVRNGNDVQVVDAKTGEDLTRVTLTQIIMEETKEQPAGLPLELLRQLVMASDHVGQEFIMWYLKSAFDAYQKFHSTIQGGLSGVQEAAFSPLAIMRQQMQRATPKSAHNDGELEQLRKRISDLENRIAPGTTAKEKKSATTKAKKRSPQPARPNR